MQRFEFDDVELTYDVRAGDVRAGGERVVFVHASAFALWYRPLIEKLADHSTLWYRRRLTTPTEAGYRPLSVAEDAAICRRLMDHVGWDRAHLVGHSYGALVVLQLAVDAPERVGCMALLEPAARGVSSAAQVVSALQPVIAAYRSGDTIGAVDAFLCHVCGDGYRAPLENAVPGAFAEAVAEADLFFQAEMPAVQQWSFGPDDAGRVMSPVLNVVGARSAERFVEASQLIQSWFPHAERLTVPDAGHLLMVQNADAMAQGLRAYLARHPLAHAEQPAPITP
jgi:pimeloyl-ACP methyl ester carboxylesterase